jgi:hypothetical protein
MSIATPGWYLYTPASADTKKQKPALRWVTVSEYWLLISAKASEAPLLSIHLGFCDFSPALPEQNYPINTLLFRTQGPSGALPVDPFAVYTHNRYDILDFNDALVQGRQRWTEVLESGNSPTSISSTLKDRKGGLLGSNKVECSLSFEGFKVTRSATDTTTYELSQVAYVRPAPFDTKQGSSFELVVNRPGGKPEMLFQCRDPAEMRQFVTIFLVLISRNLPQ